MTDEPVVWADEATPFTGRQVADLLAENARLREETAKLRGFKDWVHGYLDRHGVPTHPPGPHGAEGCRIGDRMDWLMALVEELMAERGRLRAQVQGHAERIAAQSEILSRRAEKPA